MLAQNKVRDLFLIGHPDECKVILSQGATCCHGKGLPKPPVMQPHLFSPFWVYSQMDAHLCAVDALQTCFISWEPIKKLRKFKTKGGHSLANILYVPSNKVLQ